MLAQKKEGYHQFQGEERYYYEKVSTTQPLRLKVGLTIYLLQGTVKFRFTLDPVMCSPQVFILLNSFCAFSIGHSIHVDSYMGKGDLLGISSIKNKVLTVLLRLAHSLVPTRTMEALSVLRVAEHSQGSLHFH